MLYIMQKTSSKPEDGTENTWHIGEPLPPITTTVVTFQADGDELLTILNALKATKPLEFRE
jgi:hypothetical protein